MRSADSQLHAEGRTLKPKSTKTKVSSGLYDKATYRWKIITIFNSNAIQWRRDDDPKNLAWMIVARAERRAALIWKTE